MPQHRSPGDLERKAIGNSCMRTSGLMKRIIFMTMVALSQWPPLDKSDSSQILRNKIIPSDFPVTRFDPVSFSSLFLLLLFSWPFSDLTWCF